MRKKNTIYLFRHGQSTYNRDGRFTGWIDAKLTARGRAHARGIAKQLKDKKIDVAIHTRLSRSKDTLKPVLDSHPECKLIFEDDRMIERSYGDLAGETHEHFIKRVGKQELDLRLHGDYVVSLEGMNREKVEEFLGEEEYNAVHRGYKVAGPNGESFYDVEKRVRKFIRDLKKFVRKNRVDVAISAHGNSIRLFRKVMERATREKVVKWVIPYDKVYEYTL